YLRWRGLPPPARAGVTGMANTERDDLSAIQPGEPVGRADQLSDRRTEVCFRPAHALAPVHQSRTNARGGVARPARIVRGRDEPGRRTLGRPTAARGDRAGFDATTGNGVG